MSNHPYGTKRFDAALALSRREGPAVSGREKDKKKGNLVTTFVVS